MRCRLKLANGNYIVNNFKQQNQANCLLRYFTVQETMEGGAKAN